MERKIDLCFSNFIMRGFIGRAPRRRDLLEIYKRDIVVIAPKDNLEPRFLDLAAAINSCIIESGKEGDVKDTYSYIIAALAKIYLFVTEDKDVERVYRYFSQIRNKSIDEIAREIRKINEVYKLLSGTLANDFPVGEILGCFFMDDYGTLPIPVSVERLKSRLPQVLDKFDTILWIYRSLQEIESLSKYINDFPEDWDDDIIARAKERIYEVALEIGFQPTDPIDECNLKTKLIEEENRWAQQTTDEDLASSAGNHLSMLHSLLYKMEMGDSTEYQDWEERFFAEEETKQFKVKCEQCEHEFEIETYYNGVVNTEQRSMGPEYCHEWSGDMDCPNCGSEISILHELFEYPQYFYNSEDTECTGCELLPEKTPEPAPLKTLADFM
jgi:hypothetical protein